MYRSIKKRAFELAKSKGLEVVGDMTGVDPKHLIYSSGTITHQPAEISVDMIDAVQVQFLKPIFEDDFPERGMKAWLTGVEWNTKNGYYVFR